MAQPSYFQKLMGLGGDCPAVRPPRSPFAVLPAPLANAPLGAASGAPHDADQPPYAALEGRPNTEIAVSHATAHQSSSSRECRVDEWSELGSPAQPPTARRGQLEASLRHTAKRSALPGADVPTARSQETPPALASLRGSPPTQSAGVSRPRQETQAPAAEPAASERDVGRTRVTAELRATPRASPWAVATTGAGAPTVPPTNAPVWHKASATDVRGDDRPGVTTKSAPSQGALAPAAPSNTPVLIPPRGRRVLREGASSAPACPEPPRIEIGSVEIRLPASERRLAPPERVQRTTALVREFVYPFGLRQG